MFRANEMARLGLLEGFFHGINVFAAWLKCTGREIVPFPSVWEKAGPTGFEPA